MWKCIEREDEARRVSLEVMLRGTCDCGRLPDLVENFTLFSEHKAGLFKILGQNQQFPGVNSAIASMLEAREPGHGCSGVFWQLEKMIRLNRTRADFAEKFEALIERYNAGSATIEALYAELLALSDSLNDEEQRHVRENMSEEELVIFAILTRLAPELSSEERAEVKKMARDLLARLKGLLVINWRQKSAARSQLKLTFEDTLDTGLPRACAPDLYRQKCSAVFEHMYESCPERGAGVYAG